MTKPSDNPTPRRTLRERAEELTRTSRTDIDGMSDDDVRKLAHELQVHQMELEIQNEELREAQVELAQSRDRYSDLYDFAPVGYLTLDGQGVILEANLTAAAMLGTGRQRLTNRRLTGFLPDESQETWHVHRREVFASSRSRQTLAGTENRQTLTDDLFAAGEGQSLATSATDRAATATDLTTKHVCELTLHPADRTPITVRLESVAFADADGQLSQCRTALIDVTDIRQARQRLEASEQRYRRLTDAVIDYVFSVRLENGTAVETIHGPNCEAITGYTPDDFAANSLLWISIVPQKDRALVEHHIRQTLDGERPGPLEHRLRRKDGSVLWVLRVVSPQFDEHGRVVAYDGLLRDITPRKLAEKALGRLNIRLSTSLSDRTAELAQRIDQVKLLTESVANLGEGVLITSDHLDWPGPQIVFVNDALCRITGYSAEELIGKSPRILQGDGSDRETLERIKSELSANRAVLAELVNYRKDGTAYDAEVFITPLFNAEGHRTNFVSIHRDITERKRTADALRREHELNESMIRTAQSIILVLDTHGRIVRFNPYIEELTGWTLDEVRGRDWFDTFLPERNREEIRSLFSRAISGERTRGNVNPIITRDGREVQIEWHDAPLTYVKGELLGLLCYGHDITERLRAEQVIHDREERLGAILNTAADAIITIDQRGIIEGVNAATERSFGYTADELVGQNVSMLMPAPYCDEHDSYMSSNKTIWQDQQQNRIEKNR